MESSFLPWSQLFREELIKSYPLPPEIQPVPEHVSLEPQWELKQVEESPIAHVNGGQVLPAHETADDDFDESILSVPNSTVATLDSNVRLTPLEHEQDVRHLSFSLGDRIPYSPGDVLTIYPKNFAEDVSELISLMGWSSIADNSLVFKPIDRSVSRTRQAPDLTLTLQKYSKLTLRLLLTNHLDIMSIPRRSFFITMAHFTSDKDQKERLLEFADPQNLQDLYDYTTRPRRSILEVLQEFHTVKLPWKWAASLLPTIRGRQFSIASGGKLKTAPHGDTRVELLVAIVKYRTVIKRIRQGVCTRYLASLRPGQNICVTVEKGGLHISQSEAEKPVVMIGPGTGVAPMRSLIFERASWAEDSTRGNVAQDVLFFGCRNEKADYFFRNEWDQLHDNGRLDIHTAFSRDQVGLRMCI